MGSPIGFLYLIKKALESGPSKASQRYDEAMRSGTPVERVRERTRRTVRELFAFWILGLIILMFAMPNSTAPAMPLPGQDFAMPPIFWPVLFFDTVLFVPTWALYRLIRFAIAR